MTHTRLSKSFNQVLIFSLILYISLDNGYQTQDMLTFISTALWLWEEKIGALEVALFDSVSNGFKLDK